MASNRRVVAVCSISWRLRRKYLKGCFSLSKLYQLEERDNGNILDGRQIEAGYDPKVLPRPAQVSL